MNYQTKKAEDYKEGMIIRFDKVLDTPHWAYAAVISEEEFTKNSHHE